jgi:hypothetical protein
MVTSLLPQRQVLARQDVAHLGLRPLDPHLWHVGQHLRETGVIAMALGLLAQPLLTLSKALAQIGTDAGDAVLFYTCLGQP